MRNVKKGLQLRPHVVWFGEEVPLLMEAANIVRTADILVIVGTSLAVYPAAGLAYEAPSNARLFLIDPSDVDMVSQPNLTIYKEKASTGMTRLAQLLLAD